MAASRPELRLKRRIHGAVYRALHAVAGGRRGIRVILLYHSVGGPAPHSVPREAFETQMRFLADRFSVVRLSDLRRALASAGRDTNLACVTFDDGYLDNWETAVPILDRLGLKGTFFIATGYVGSVFPTRFGSWPVMTASQIAACADLGHDVGAHTVTHPKLTDLAPHAVRDEIVESKRYLEDLTGRPVTTMAYPKGARNLSVRSLVAAARYETAVATREGLVEAGVDWLDLPRIRITDGMTLAGFDMRLSAASGLYARLRASAAGASRAAEEGSWHAGTP